MEAPSTHRSCSCSQASAMQMTSRNWASPWCATFRVSPLLHCSQRVFLLNKKDLLYFISMEGTGISAPQHCHISLVSLRVPHASQDTSPPTRAPKSL